MDGGALRIEDMMGTPMGSEGKGARTRGEGQGGGS